MSFLRGEHLGGWLAPSLLEIRAVMSCWLTSLLDVDALSRMSQVVTQPLSFKVSYGHFGVMAKLFLPKALWELLVTFLALGWRGRGEDQ